MGGWYHCRNKAKMQHEGKSYCGIHDPVKRKSREDERHHKLNAKWKTEWAREKESRHKLDTWDGLVAGLEGAIARIERLNEGGPDEIEDERLTDAKAALKAAKQS